MAIDSLTAHVHLGEPRAALDVLAIPGAILEGHFELLSGRHSDRFVAFSRIADDASALEKIVSWLVPSLAPTAPDVIVAPRTAGVALGWTLARRLGAPLHLADVDEHGRPEGLLGTPDLGDVRALVVNDVVTTGTGLQRLGTLVADAGAQLVGAAWFLSRGAVNVGGALGVPTAHVATVEMPSWPASQCSLCESDASPALGIDLN